MDLERALYQTPPRGKIRIARWKRPNTVQMIRQDHDGFYLEAMVLANFDKGLPQYVNMAQQQTAYCPDCLTKLLTH